MVRACLPTSTGPATGAIYLIWLYMWTAAATGAMPTISWIMLFISGYLNIAIMIMIFLTSQEYLFIITQKAVVPME